MTVIMEDGQWAKPKPWDACSEPERPVDHATFFREGCRACLIKLHAWGRQLAVSGRPQKIVDTRPTSDTFRQLITIDTALQSEGIVLPRAGRLP